MTLRKLLLRLVFMQPFSSKRSSLEELRSSFGCGAMMSGPRGRSASATLAHVLLGSAVAKRVHEANRIHLLIDDLFFDNIHARRFIHRSDLSTEVNNVLRVYPHFQNLHFIFFSILHQVISNQSSGRFEILQG